jgi:hypothetical protein
MIEYSALAAHGNSLLWKLASPPGAGFIYTNSLSVLCVRAKYIQLRKKHARQTQAK